MQPKYPDILFAAVLPSSTRLIASLDGSDVLAYDNNDLNEIFQVKPSPSNDPCILKINNNDTERYRGCLEIKRLSGSDMTVINMLPFEQYLYGVVPHEVGPLSPIEALKAQATAARTYALDNLNEYDRLSFDLCPTTYSQVYKGFNEETPNTNRSVDETKGKRILYKGKLAEVFYFDSCSGVTEDAKNVWGTDVPYLKSVEDKYESGKSWNYTWETTLSSDNIKQILSNKKIDIGNILGIKITNYSNTGRVIGLTILGTLGDKNFTLEKCRTIFQLYSQWFNISTNTDKSIIRSTPSSINIFNISNVWNNPIITSTGIKTIDQSNTQNISLLGANNQNKTLSVAPTTYTFKGRGWGHAVGMCQEGAQGMAMAGFKCDDILKHYFSGTTIE